MTLWLGKMRLDGIDFKGDWKKGCVDPECCSVDDKALILVWPRDRYRDGRKFEGEDDAALERYLIKAKQESIKVRKDLRRKTTKIQEKRDSTASEAFESKIRSESVREPKAKENDSKGRRSRKPVAELEPSPEVESRAAAGAPPAAGGSARSGKAALATCSRCFLKFEGLVCRKLYQNCNGLL
jgi:hypothetical protein